MTNVRHAVTDPARTLGLAAAFFAALVFAGWEAGVFAQLGFELSTALAAFALAFTALTVGCDRELREYLAARLRSLPRHDSPPRAPHRIRSTAAKSPAAKQAAS